MTRQTIREHGAITIQRNWRAFASQRRRVAQDALMLASVMGKPLVDTEDYFDFMDEGRILVQVNGDPDEPIKGHSRFYFKYMSYELLFSGSPTDPADQFAKYSMSSDMANYLNSRGSSAALPGSRGAIFRTKVDEYVMPGSVATLIPRRRLFVLDEKYSKNFDMACQREASHFGDAPYSYGLHYNCNTFVFNVLRKLRDTTR